MGKQSWKYFEANGILSIKTPTHAPFILHPAMIRPTVTFRPEFVKYDGIRRISDRKARLADTHRVFRIFTETQDTGTKPRIKQTYLLDDFPFQGNISSSKISDRANPIAIVNNRDIVFPEMALIRWPPSGIQTRKNSALNHTEVVVAMTLPMFDEPVAVHDNIVVGENEEVPPSDTDAVV